MDLEAIGVTVMDVKLGQVTIKYDPLRIPFEKIVESIHNSGFEIVEDREKILVEQLKTSIIDLVRNSTYNAMVRNSDYLVEKFGLSYPHLSSLFSKHERTTIEKYFIFQKITKVKELIDYGELTLSEIAYMMGYSSVQYLSTQFKNITGVSVTEFKKDPETHRNIEDTLGN
ncbi:MAG: AraC family transcriptional regulator [Bacteroidetes bacterium]|nr:AraC family transcriptional regulator [Bacteroidota bacterium]